MKVLHVIVGLGDGGAERSLYKLVSADAENNHTVVSLTTEGKYGSLLRRRGLTLVSLRWSPLRGFVAFLRLVSIIRRERPDAVHTWMPHASLLGSAAARLARCPKIFWSIRASDYGRGVKTWPTRLIVRLLGFASSRLPRKIFVVGARALKQHVAIGFSPAKMVLAPNGYKTPEQVGSSARKGLPWADKQLHEEVTLGMVARYHPQKDHATFLESLSIVADANSNFSCFLAGDGVGYDNAALVAELERFGLSNKVKLLGQLPDPQELYSKLDLHILSSSYGEGFPNVVAESMLAAVPNIVTDVGDSAEIVSDTGWVVEPGSAEGLAAGIRAAMNLTFQERQEKGKKARGRILNNYSLEKMVAAHLEEYAALDVAVFPRYDNLGASSRIRILQFIPGLRREGWGVTTYPFSSNRYLSQLYRGRRSSVEVLRSYLRRIRDLFRARKADVVLVEKEFLPWAPWCVEKLLVPSFRRIIYDFDDAVHEHYREHPKFLVRTALQAKIGKCVSRANGIIAGNSFLADYLAPLSAGPTAIIPSVVNTEEVFPLPSGPRDDRKPFICGWIGTPITWKAYGERLMPVFEGLGRELEAQFLIVGGGDGSRSTPHVKFVPWSFAQENSLLNSFDVGIMPLADDPWSRGKCGFKLLQCMAAGVPVIASAVGANRDIVSHGVDGYLVENDQDWGTYLRALRTKPQDLAAMGDKALEKVRDRYSLEFATPLLTEFLRRNL